MRVNSTGLGKTTMIADFEGFQTAVTQKLAGQYEVRGLIKKALRPNVLFRVLSILCRGSRLD
ncbi:MAG: hypothetical protein ABSC19_18860 [Syntrophorhabdales bacterium]